MEVTCVELDTSLQLFASPSRRRLLMNLLASNPLDATDIPAKMATDDAEVTGFETRLYHIHLPMLDDARIIEWDRDTDVVTRGPAFHEIQPLLTLMDEHRDELPEHWF